MKTATLDLRTRQYELQRLPATKRIALVTGLVTALVLALGDLILAVLLAVVPMTVPFDVDGMEDPPEVSSVAHESVDARPGEEIVRIGGLNPSDSAGVGLEEVIASLRGNKSVDLVLRDRDGSDERSVQIALVREHWFPALGEVLWALVVASIAGLGLVVLRARAQHPSVGRFVVLCLVATLPMATLDTVENLVRVWNPWAIWGLDAWMVLSFLVLVVWPILFGWAILRFLHVFPSPLSEIEDRFSLPPWIRHRQWFVWTIGVGLVLAAVGFMAEGALASAALGIALVLGVLGILYLVPFAWIRWMIRAAVRAYRLAQHRLASAQAGEVQQLRLTFAGVRLGAVLFLTLLLLVVPLSIFVGAAGGPGQQVVFGVFGP